MASSQHIMDLPAQSLVLYFLELQQEGDHRVELCGEPVTGQEVLALPQEARTVIAIQLILAIVTCNRGLYLIVNKNNL